MRMIKRGPGTDTLEFFNPDLDLARPGIIAEMRCAAFAHR